MAGNPKTIGGIGIRGECDPLLKAGSASSLARRDVTGNSRGEMRRELETVLKIVCESSREQLPELLGDLERVRVTAIARVNRPIIGNCSRRKF
jgi:hypothetical protein